MIDLIFKKKPLNEVTVEHAARIAMVKPDEIKELEPRVAVGFLKRDETVKRFAARGHTYVFTSQCILIEEGAGVRPICYTLADGLGYYVPGFSTAIEAAKLAGQLAALKATLPFLEGSTVDLAKVRANVNNAINLINRDVYALAEQINEN